MVDKEERQQGIAGPDVVAGWIMLILSIVLYLSDIFVTSFNGIDAKWIFDLNILDYIMKTGVLTVFIIVIIFEFFLGGAKTRDEKIWAATYAAVWAFIFAVTAGSGGAILHLAFASVLWFFLIKPSASIPNGYKTITILIFLDFLLFTILEIIFESAGLTGSLWFANRLIVPIYPLYMLAYLRKYGSKFAGILLALLFSSYVIAAITTSPQFQLFTATLEEEKKEEALTFAETSVRRFGEMGAILTDPLACLEHIGTPPKYEVCLKEREYARLCVDKKGTPEYELCLKGKRIGEVRGAEDITIKEYTKVEFEKTDAFPKQIFKEFAPPIPLQLNIESPKKPIDIFLSCKFKYGTEEINGTIESENPLKEVKGIKKETVLCKLPKTYEKGEYKITFEAEIQGIETTARLTRLFVGKKITEKRKNELLALHGLKAIEPSRAPEEFAVFSISIGTPATTPTLDNSPKQPLIGSIENKADGIITSIKENLLIELVPGVTPTEACSTFFDQMDNHLKIKRDKLRALNKLKNLERIKKGSRPPVIVCNLDIAPELQEPGREYLKREFRSYIEYSYKIAKEERFEVISYE